jgi:hypothetical protein
VAQLSDCGGLISCHVFKQADEQIPASEYYERAAELIQQVEDATEVSGQRAEDKDDLREKLEVGTHPSGQICSPKYF